MIKINVDCCFINMDFCTSFLSGCLHFFVLCCVRGGFVKLETSGVNPIDWTVADVASYFTAVGFPEQALAFRTQVQNSTT